MITLAREYNNLQFSANSESINFGYHNMPRKQSTKSELEVVEVYDLAISISKEFQNIIDNHGPESINKLMPQVITALEYLEGQADNHQRLTDECSDLKRTVERLHSEKSKRSELKDYYVKEITELEHTCDLEASEYRKAIENLQHENADLHRSLDSYKRSSVISTNSNDSSNSLDGQQEVVRLRGQLSQQTDDIRQLRRERRQKSIDIDMLKKEVDKLSLDNASNKHKSMVSKEKADQLSEDKKELRLLLADKETEILNISTLLGNADGPNEDDMPRFTLNELRDLLDERNLLKCRLFDFEIMSDSDCDTSSSCANDEVGVNLGGELSEVEARENSLICDSDQPVQGPINKEPRDKICPDESLIKRLFKFINKSKHPRYYDNRFPSQRVNFQRRKS